MDINWTKHQRFLLRALLTLIASFLLYFTFIRQVRIKINSELIYPIFVQYEESSNAKIIATQRRINIIPNGHSTPRGFGIPFGGYFLLPFTILLISRDLKVASGLIGYHLFLFIAPPSIALLYIRGNNLAGTFLQINEMIFTLIFLTSLLYGGNRIFNILKEKKPQ